MKDILEQLKILPNLSGSYQFFDENNSIIYIGKAKNLKKRVSNYFNKSQSSEKTRVMVPKINKIEFIITNSEVEALILESHLIKKYKPKYNVLLKDDKKFPYFVITEEEYPRILVTRKRNKNPIKGKYFGPYTDARAMYATLDLLKKLFPLKQCKTPKFKNRPCIYHQIGRCQAPCQRLVAPAEYQETIKNVELFLSGKQNKLVEELRIQMEKYAKNQQFEKAARYRDSYFDVQKTMEKQKVIYENTSINQDVIAISRDSNACGLSLIQIRDGRLIEKKDFELYASGFDSDAELLSTFIKEYYELVSEFDIPSEIIFKIELQDEDLKVFENWLSEKRGKKVKLNSTKNAKNSEIIELAQKNSNYYLEKLKITSLMKIQNDYNDIGNYIQEKLSLKKFPHKVECFDISHIQGTNTVASMVVFENGFAKKSEYKKFKIKSVEEKPDDFKSIQEVVYRRYNKLKTMNLAFPDLIIVDGGKGQLSSALASLNELEIKEQDIVSLAKRIEEIFIPNKNKPVIFPISSNALHFFQRVRDEAHRFAITYHRQLRGKKAVESTLDNIKGLYIKNKKLLLEKYGSINNISKLTIEEISQLLSKSQSKIVYDYFKSKSP